MDRPLLSAVVWLLCACITSACGSRSPTAPSPPAADFASQFDSLWNTFDREYSYFAHKQIDWNALRSAYRPRALAVSDQRAFMDVIREMLGHLHDGHVSLRDPGGAHIPTFQSSAFVNWDRAVFDQYRSRAGWTQGQIDWGHGVLDGVPYIAIGAWSPQAIRAADFDAAFERFNADHRWLREIP